MHPATDPSVVQELEKDMKMKAVVIGGIAVTAALAGGWALAQTVSPGPSGFGPRFTHGKDGMGSGMMEHMGKGMGHGMMKGHGMVKGTGPDMMDGRRGSGFDPAQTAAIKTKFGITPAQEPVWSKYAKAVEDAAAAVKTAREGFDPETIGKMNPADRFAFVTRLRERGEEQFEAVKLAATELLATLNDSQKAKATDILPGLAAFGPAMMRGADMGGPRHRH